MKDNSEWEIFLTEGQEAYFVMFLAVFNYALYFCIGWQIAEFYK